MAKFNKLRQEGHYTDCLKFYQATLSSGGTAASGTSSTLDKRVAIKPRNPDIDSSRRNQVFANEGEK